MSSFNVDAIKKQLRSNFGSYLGDDILEECVQLCKIYNVSGEDLFYTWEAITYGRGGARQVTLGTIDEIKQRLQKEMQKKQQATKSNKPTLPTRGLNGLMRSGGNTNIFNRLGLSTQPKTEPQTFGVPSAGESSRSAYRSSSIQFSLLSDGSSIEEPRTYRYMYEKITERSEVLDDRIEDMAQLVKDHYDIPEFSDPTSATEEEVVVIGRITMDSESASAESSKLNEASLTIESSRTTGSGARVPLKFDPGVKIRQAVRGTAGLGFFPGAIVVLKGNNGSGDRFYVTEILSLPPLPAPDQTATTKSENFTVHAVCGPYTPDVDLEYKPWRAFIQKLNMHKPQVALLLGPFLDSNNHSLRRGDIDSPPETIFRQIFVEPLQAYLDSNPDALVLVVPGVRDMLSDHAVHPQAQLPSDLFNDPRIMLLPNPCRFSLNGITFAVTSVDVLFHLRKDEFVKRAMEVESVGPEGVEIPVDPMANLCRHLLQQRSFYPQFPSPTDLAHEVNLDITHSDFLQIPQRPDVLILPSRLRQFTKMLEGTVASNPSFATKGTYALLNCGPSQGEAKIHAEIVKMDQ